MSILRPLTFHRGAQHSPAKLPQQGAVHFTGINLSLETNYFHAATAKFKNTNAELKGNSKGGGGINQ
jgi:hypothetical protein